MAGLALAQAQQKAPPPAEDAQAKAEKQIKEIFTEDYAKTKPADLKALSAKLLKQARETTDDPAARYVLFRESADLAARAGDAVTAIQVAGEWARAFAIDERVMKSDKLLLASKAAGSNADLKNVAEAALTLVDEAVATDDYATALRLIVAAHDNAKRGSHSTLAKQIDARRIDLEVMDKQFPAVKEALETLATKPDDADACRLAGKFLCYWKGDWDRGLTYLAKGFKDELGTLARKDRANPPDAAEMVEVADGWWDIAESLSGGAKVNVLRRAMNLYEAAVPNLTGLNRTKVEQRIKQAGELMPEELLGEIRTMLGHTNGVIGIAFSPNGLWAASGGGDRSVRLWNVASGKEIRRFDGHQHTVGGVDFAPNGKQLVSASADQTIRLWDIETGKELRQFVGHTDKLRHVRFTPDGKSILSSSWDQTVRLWDVQTGHETRRYSANSNANDAVASSDGTKVLTGGDGKQLIVWDLESGREIRRMRGHTAQIVACRFSPNGELAASGGHDKIIRLWNVDTGQLLRQLTGHIDCVEGLAFSPNGRYLLSTSRDSTLRLWNVGTGREVQKSKGTQSGPLSDVVFSPDGRRALTTGADAVVRLWAVPK